MDHNEVVDFFLFNNVQKHTPVFIKHKNGNVIKARIALDIVYFDYDEIGNIINSRIGIIATKPPTDFVINPTPIVLFSNDIISLKIDN